MISTGLTKFCFWKGLNTLGLNQLIIILDPAKPKKYYDFKTSMFYNSLGSFVYPSFLAPLESILKLQYIFF